MGPPIKNNKVDDVRRVGWFENMSIMFILKDW